MNMFNFIEEQIRKKILLCFLFLFYKCKNYYIINKINILIFVILVQKCEFKFQHMCL